MKKLKFLFIALLAPLFALGACDNGGGSGGGGGTTPVITLARESIELDVGEDYVVEASVTPEGTLLAYKSSNAAVASVSDAGVVKAVAVGEANITVSVKDFSSATPKNLKVTVKEAQGGGGSTDELERYRTQTIENMRSILEDLDQFGSEKDKAKAAINEAIAKVQAAKTEEEISKISRELTNALKDYKLTGQKNAALEEVNAVDVTKYVDDEQANLTKLINDTKTAINAATKSGEIKEAMESFRTELAKFHLKSEGGEGGEGGQGQGGEGQGQGGEGEALVIPETGNVMVIGKQVITLTADPAAQNTGAFASRKEGYKNLVSGVKAGDQFKVFVDGEECAFVNMAGDNLENKDNQGQPAPIYNNVVKKDGKFYVQVDNENQNNLYVNLWNANDAGEEWFTFMLEGGNSANHDGGSSEGGQGGQEQGEKIEIHFINKNNWENVYAYAWKGNGGDGNQNAAWPGVKMEIANNNDYKVFIDKSLTKIIFNDGVGGTGKQTADLDIPSDKNLFDGESWYKENEYYDGQQGGQGGEDGGQGQQGQGGDAETVTITISFTNDWDVFAANAVFCVWAWEDGQEGQWFDTRADAEAKTLTVELPATIAAFQVVRMNPNAEKGWDAKWNASDNITFVPGTLTYSVGLK